MKRILYYVAPLFIVGVLYAWNTTAPYVDPATVTTATTNITNLQSADTTIRLSTAGVVIQDGTGIGGAANTKSVSFTTATVKGDQFSVGGSTMTIDDGKVTAANLVASTSFKLPKISSGVAPTEIGLMGWDYVGAVVTVYRSTSTESEGWK